MFRISYFKHESGNYYVTLHVAAQTIVLLPGFFIRVMRLQGNVLAGSWDVDAQTLKELGFVIPEQWLLKSV